MVLSKGTFRRNLPDPQGVSSVTFGRAHMVSPLTTDGKPSEMESITYDHRATRQIGFPSGAVSK